MEKQTPKTKIQFKPVHDGMGFHPFSDGLPYAPASKSTKTGTTLTTPTTGYGATAAARPQFATPNSPRPITPAQNAFRGTLNLQPVVEASVSLNTAAVAMTSISQRQVLRKRFFAYTLDTVVHAGFWLLTNLAAFFIFNFQLDVELFQEHLLQFIAFFSVSQWLFIALQEMLFETTIGKSFFNLEFKRNHSSLLLRSLVFMMGIAFVGVGLFLRPQDYFGKVDFKHDSK